MSAIKIDELNEKLGAYLREDKDVLISEVLQGQDLEGKFEMWDDVKDEIPLPNLTIGGLVKPANAKDFTPNADALKFGSRMLKVRAMKVDLLLVPSDLEKTWLGKVNKKGSDVYEMPYEQYIMKYITEKAQEEVYLQSVYKGIYNAAGTTAADTMDGLLRLIALEITAGTIVPVVTGVITATNVIDKLEQVYDNLGEAYKNMNTQMLVSPTIFDWYVRRYRTLYNASVTYTGVSRLETMLDGTNCTIVKEVGLSGSQRVICTPVANKVWGYDSTSDINNIITQVFNRTIKLMMDFKGGTQLKEVHARALAVNDQA